MRILDKVVDDAPHKYATIRSLFGGVSNIAFGKVTRKTVAKTPVKTVENRVWRRMTVSLY